jgi:hypothetical protein
MLLRLCESHGEYFSQIEKHCSSFDHVENSCIYPGSGNVTSEMASKSIHDAEYVLTFCTEVSMAQTQDEPEQGPTLTM